MLEKNISDIVYEDIAELKENKIRESNVLDYKVSMPDDNSLVKNVCAFANTRGGHIIVGVQESGDGGYPVSIDGIPSKTGQERIEHVILSRVEPRLNVGIKSVNIPETDMVVLVIHVPDSYTRPHHANHKFYKRFNFKSEPMTEQEIADAYKNRFSNTESLEKYVEKTLYSGPSGIVGNIIVIPSNIRHRLIDTYDPSKYNMIESLEPRSYGRFRVLLPTKLQPFSHGLISRPLDGKRDIQTCIHRNGCVHHVGYFHQMGRFGGPDNVMRLSYSHVAVRIMQTIEFASKIMAAYNYFGEQKAILTLSSSSETALMWEQDGLVGESGEPMRLDLTIEREYPSDYAKENYQQITAFMMHELFNYYGMPRCPRFDENNKWQNE